MVRNGFRNHPKYSSEAARTETASDRNKTYPRLPGVAVPKRHAAQVRDLTGIQKTSLSSTPEKGLYTETLKIGGSLWFPIEHTI